MDDLKIKIDGKDYVFDVDKAKQLGVLKEDTTIKDVSVGDVFRYVDSGNLLVVVPHGYNPNPGTERFNIAGRQGGLYVYSYFGKDGATKEQLLLYLNSSNTGVYLKKFVKNINDDFKQLLENLPNKS